LRAALRLAKLVTNPDLNGVVMHRQPATEKLNMVDAQGNRFAPSQAAVRQDQHQRAMLGLRCQPANVLSRQVDTALVRLAGQILHAAAEFDAGRRPLTASSKMPA
jgi:hypothetical protein